MTFRKLIIPLVALAMMTLMLAPTGASASPHETVGELVADCVVEGSVTLDDPDTAGTGNPGLDNNRSNNTYQFRDTTLECVSLLVPKLDGDYDVQANGDTANFFHDAELPAGENCDEGGSAEDPTDEVHSGNLDADAINPTVNNDFTGNVHFVRLGTTVLADGPLTDDKGDEFFFQAELEFIPQDGDCATDPAQNASLTGTGEIYRNVVAHECNADAVNFNDSHCS